MSELIVRVDNATLLASSSKALKSMPSLYAILFYKFAYNHFM